MLSIQASTNRFYTLMNNLLIKMRPMPNSSMKYDPVLAQKREKGKEDKIQAVKLLLAHC